MSSSESSGAPAEGSATSPAPAAEFPSFGSTRGSGLARGKRPSAGPAASAAASTAYTPTAIEVVNAPREYVNPFAPAEEPAPAPAAIPVPSVQPVVTEQAIETPKSETSIPPAPAARFEPSSDSVPAELNILPPAEQKSAPHQTWESDGFSGQRESRRERPRRDETPDEPVDIASIPPQFLYVRPGVTFVPTPRNWGGAPRERNRPPAGEGAPRREDSPRRDESPRHADVTLTPHASPAKPGGIFGWLKSLFGGESAPAEAPVAAGHGGDESRREGGQRRSRSGRGGGGGGGHRRHRGGRSRGGARSGDAT